MVLSLTTDQLISSVSEIKAGERILLSGTIYTARDAAHQRMAMLIAEGKPLPFPVKNSVLYYCGPTPPRPGEVIGSCGPTTSSRMDPYTPLMLEQGVKATIGKGTRSAAVIAALQKYHSLYLVATGGAGALLSRKVRRAGPVAFEDLGPEAIFRLEVMDFPLIVAVDSMGNNIFERK
ncbi:MAG: fumarate hydratase [Elusimicrobia bacterium RIFOXYA2_FULL_50_26]|nr:MAG: fumarate hydratase [Elusimicrobia bacterium RIFOXYA2_FULL_50_26]OGS23534.1 MAG: fumarate hydratase [Elusimicrobia bacterium RIFOXYB2_FULL_50_12]